MTLEKVKIKQGSLTGKEIPKINRNYGIAGGFIVLNIAGKKAEHLRYNCQCTTCGKISIKIVGRIRAGAIACRCHSYIASVKNNARKRNIIFNIHEKQIWNKLIKQDFKCVLTGQHIYFNSNKNKTASLDRIDSAKGYTKDNIQWLHKDINKIKMEFSQDKFIEMCVQIVSYIGKQNEE